jgi:uncharacterized phage protein gp47/JayE
MGIYVTDTGFIKKRQDDIKTELEDSYKIIYGNDVNLLPESTNGQEIGVYSESLSDIWDLLEVLYYQGDPGASKGRVQELLYSLNGITRNQASKTKADLEISGAPGTVVNVDFQAKNSNNLVFQILEVIDTERIIDGTGKITLKAESLITGYNVAVADTINIIVNSQAGITSVTNPEDAVTGTDKESNSRFRLRRSLSTAIPGENIIESLFSQLSDLDDVAFVRVYQNRSSVTQPETNIPPHSFMAVVEGGNDDEISEIIWRNTNCGIGSYGNEENTVIDPNGFEATVYFQRPALIDVVIVVNLTAKTEDMPQETIDLIKQNIVDYSAGLLSEETGGFPGFNIGQNISISRLYQPINLVQNHFITSITINGLPSDLSITKLQKGNFLTSNITVIVTPL